jgi:catechol 2,3-dioxygenase-like lactoylglutathione lyase family enzyme
MRTLDHIGLAVADYGRSKEFYEMALAPLGMTLLMEFSGAAAGFGREDGERPSFFIEAHGSSSTAAFTLRSRPKTVRKWTPSMPLRSTRVGSTTARPVSVGTTPTTTARMSWIQTATTSKPPATNRPRTSAARVFGSDARAACRRSGRGGSVSRRDVREVEHVFPARPRQREPPTSS